MVQVRSTQSSDTFGPDLRTVDATVNLSHGELEKLVEILHFSVVFAMAR